MKGEKKQGVFSGSWAKAALAAVMMLLLTVQTVFAVTYYSMPNATGTFSDPIWCSDGYYVYTKDCQVDEYQIAAYCNRSLAQGDSLYIMCNSNINFESGTFQIGALNVWKGSLNVSGGTLSVEKKIAPYPEYLDSAQSHPSVTLNISGGTHSINAIRHIDKVN